MAITPEDQRCYRTSSLESPHAITTFLSARRPVTPNRTATYLALGAIFLWGTLAPLIVLLRHVPLFLLTGLGLMVGSLIALPLSRGKLSRIQAPPRTLLLGVYGLFGYHFLLFIALRNAPPVQANLVNYLWPLGIVLMAPMFLPGMRLRKLHVAAALLGFAGAAVAILGGNNNPSNIQSGFAWGYVPALASAFVWASYSLLTQRVPPFPSAAIGLFGLVSGMLSLLCHAALEPTVALSTSDWLLIAALGLGPLGAAFYLWDAALKRGDARQIGVLSFITPLLSTLALLWVRQEPPSASVALAAAMIIGAAVLGSRVKT